jgi:hypothetical protein
MIVADWATAGPWRNLSWLTIVFTALVLLGLVLIVMEAWDAWKTRQAVNASGKNGAMEILGDSSLIRSLSRTGISLCFLAVALVSIYIETRLRLSSTDIEIFRVTFVAGLMLAVTLKIVIAFNDLYSRRKLFGILDGLESSEAEKWASGGEER